jgi:hypothetical protein
MEASLIVTVHLSLRRAALACLVTGWTLEGERTWVRLFAFWEGYYADPDLDRG